MESFIFSGKFNKAFIIRMWIEIKHINFFRYIFSNGIWNYKRCLLITLLVNSTQSPAISTIWLSHNEEDNSTSYSCDLKYHRIFNTFELFFGRLFHCLIERKKQDQQCHNGMYVVSCGYTMPQVHTWHWNS